METGKAGIDAGSEKEQLDGLLLLANEQGPDFEPGAEGVAGGRDSGQKGGGDSGALLGVLVMSVCSVVAARRGDHWQLKPEEAEQVGQAAGAVLDKYVPNVEAGPEFALVMVCLTVFGPRAMADIQMQGAGEPPKQEAGKGGDKPTDKS